MTDTTVTTLLLLADAAPWETEALAAIGGTPGMVVHKRCIDVSDLLATASVGQASVAVVAAGTTGFDRPAVEHLHRYGVHVLAVVPEHWRDDQIEELRRGGVAELVPEREIARLAQVARGVRAALPDVTPPTQAGPVTSAGNGRVVAVWGPAGAPGRTTIALGLTGAWAANGADPLLLDADPWGGSVAQHLGVVDDVSGLLTCNRHHIAGTLAPAYVSLQRRAAGFRVVTGLPRADRWPEVRPESLEEMIRLGRRQGAVVIDTGFALEDDPTADYTGRPGRNELTRTAIAAADEVVVVGSADPVGLTRLARGLAELREGLVVGPVHVVVNRMRRSLGWSEADLAGMLSGFGPLHGLHFLPDDRGTTDRGLLTGRTVLELGDSGLARGLRDLADAVLPVLSRRRGGRVRRR